MTGRIRAEALVAAAVGGLLGCGAPAVEPTFQPVTFPGGPTTAELAPLGHAIGSRRIVLLGENGHGVGEFTAAKVRLVEWLHREKGFDVVVMESGFFECGRAWSRAADLAPRRMLHDCLKYPFQQAEILPLFDLIAARRTTERPLTLAGMDPQPQGYDSGQRPAVLHAALSPLDPALARRVAAFDSALFLVPDSGGVGDGIDHWVLENGPAARAAYDSAAALTTGWERWAIRLAAGFVDRLAARAEAGAAGAGEPPASYYQLRDEWMARAVGALADSIAGSRKVVVWLHNDHARYGDFGGGIRSVGGFLREWYGDDVYSIGLFMGRGTIADNGRNEQDVAEIIPGGIESFLASEGHAAGYLLLHGNRGPAVRAWADSARPYLRMGLAPMEMIPAAEFDALLYVDSVGAPEYRIP